VLDATYTYAAVLSRRVAVIALVLALAAVAGAQGPPPAVRSPEVHADRRVTFRLRAPNAAHVDLVGEVLQGKPPRPMTKDAHGVWSLTIGPLPPEIWIYNFRIEGVDLPDPANISQMPRAAGTAISSFVEVPGDGAAFYDARPVPHGDVRMVLYESAAMGVDRYLWVYTPPGYDTSTERYPVYYLLHGNGETQSGWVANGRANIILDNLIAEKKARPMVVVMPLGHTIQSFWTGPAKTVSDPIFAAMRPGSSLDDIISAMMSGDGKGGLGPFGRDVVDDVMPLIERTYKVSKRPEDRAVAGLSMGGGHSLNLAFAKPELFRYVVLMSPAVTGRVDQYYSAVMKNPETVNKQFKLFWVGVGKDDTLTGPGDHAFVEALKKNGVKHTFVESDGRHEWTVWRHYLNEVAPLLFK
jgi:enterochelin esterase family protein